MNFNSLKGRRACVAVRIGSGLDIEDQLDSCRAFARRHGMFLGYEQYYNGSQGTFDQMIESMIEEKRSGSGYDCVLIRDFSDFSGSDSGHTAEALMALHAEGLVVIPSRLNGEEAHS